LLRPQRDASSSDGAVIERLNRIKTLARSMTDALAAGDLPRFGALLDESWRLKRGLSQGVTSPRIDRWYALARRHGAYGGKIAGAGGGGHFVFCVPPHRRAAVAAALAQEGLTPLPLTLDRHGCIAHGQLVDPPRSSPLTTKGSTHELVRSILS
jgi:D-glycero-alpha-D-manno-heptose-7-phosphate kinase